MNKFLQQVADYIFQTHHNRLGDLTLVFPNRRAGLFFQKYLSSLIEGPVFSPRVSTISELVSELSGLKPLDQNRLVLELFDIYQQVTKSAETLDEFYYWGEMMLADFNDIDKYLVDTKQLFSNIKSLREIDSGFDFLTPEQKAYISTFWNNILLARDSESKQQFISIWQNLPEIYTRFSQHLQANGYAYEGLIYRKLAENLPGYASKLNNNFIAIIGFNALNLCEKKIFNQLKVNAHASFFWDYDDYYTNARRHEAAMFMGENLQLFPMPEDFYLNTDNFSQLKSIDVVAVPGFSGQTTFAANWLNMNSDKVTGDFDNTAIVLCDENLLTAMLGVLPDHLEQFNITMGYPLKSSPVFDLIKGLVDIDRNSRPGADGQPVFYYRNVMGLLSNPLLKTLLGDFTEQLLERVKKENRIYLDNSDFNPLPILSYIFDLPAEAVQCKDYLQQVIRYAFSATNEQESIIKESLYQLHLAVSRVSDSVFACTSDKARPLISKKLFYQLLLRQLDRLTIPFEGEPLSGTQIMGFLETRCLDFDNVILLSFNDDKLPGTPHQHSFIPYSLRKGFGLPSVEQRNAMYAYYFYRLIQRAKNVSLVYDSRTDGLSKGEVSRFATQLKYEAGHLKLIEKQAVFNFEPAEQQAIVVEKTPGILAKTGHHLVNKRISPSALNTYIDCKLKFFLKYIENISETDDVAEDIDHLLFGRIAHVALELIYQPHIEQTLSKEIIEKLLRDTKLINNSLQKALEKEYFKGGKMNLNGRNLLVFEVIKKYVLRVLRYDQSIAPFKLIGLEKDYEDNISIETNNGLLNIRYGGTVDRIDEVEGRIRVVDYKTGKAASTVASIERLFIDKANRNKAAFQTMLYAGCVANTLKTAQPIMPAVYGARDVFKDDFDPLFSLNGGNLIYQANADEFTERLRLLLGEIIDPAVPFDQTKDINKCNYCQFNGICCR
jgi:hypothetical protein